MQMTASLFTYQGQQRASVIGFMMRASVGLRELTKLMTAHRHDLTEIHAVVREVEDREYEWTLDDYGVRRRVFLSKAVY